MPETQPVEATKNKEFYMDKGVIKTRTPADLTKSREDYSKETNIPITFPCWECEPTHTHFFHQDWSNWNLECQRCGKKFHGMVDVTDYKEVIDGVSR